MKEKQELKKQLIILSIVLLFVIGIAIILNMKDRNTESYTKIKDSTSSQQENVQNTSVDDFMDRLKGLVEENDNTITNKTDDQSTIHYENTDIIQLDTGEIVLYSEEEQDNQDFQEE
ncbi:MAG: hypothetical protein HFJ60_04125 [Clostridia bacterium]|jgi:hypothetical protein|nr:hypothetical protein [Clostridia bacterium]